MIYFNTKTWEEVKKRHIDIDCVPYKKVKIEIIDGNEVTQFDKNNNPIIETLFDISKFTKKYTNWINDLPVEMSTEEKTGVDEQLMEQDLRSNAVRDLQNSDAGMVRVIDDILEFLVNGVEIPQVAKDKLANRKNLRTKI